MLTIMQCWEYLVAIYFLFCCTSTLDSTTTTPIRKCIYSDFTHMASGTEGMGKFVLSRPKKSHISTEYARIRITIFCFILQRNIVKDMAWQKSSRPIWKANQRVGAMNEYAN